MRTPTVALVLGLLMSGLAGMGNAQAQPSTAAPADRFVTVEGRRIHYLEWGGADKPPFVMIHGIGRIAHTFDHLAPRFVDRYHVIAYDMRGHGDSDWDPAANYLVEDHVKDLEALVAQLKLRGLTLLGNSTGGRVAQVYAGLHPENTAALIVEDVGPERPSSIANNFQRTVEREANGWASEDELVAQLKTGSGSTADSILRTYVHFGTKPGATGRIVWKRDPALAKGFVETELWRYVRQIKCPTIYVIGGRSTIVPPATQEELKRTIPGVEIVVMAGLGHYPDQEAPDAFVVIANRFLDAHR